MEFPLTHVRYVALTMPDPAAEARFFTEEWLLDAVSAGGGDGHFFAGAGSTEPYLLRLGAGPARSLDLVAFAGRDRAAVDMLHARLVDKGERIIAPPAAFDRPEGGYGFRFFDLDGRAIEISSDVAPRALPGDPVGEGVPLDISHVVLHTRDPEAAAAYYGEMLGFEVADWLDRRMCFLRTGPKHHCLAFLTGEPSLNHIAFDLGSTNSVMRGVGRLMRGARRPKWGPGRHTAGDNTFAYFITPAGNMMEYTAELETVGPDWQPTTYAMSAEIADQWGTGTLAGPFTPHVSTRDPGLWNLPTC
jgi:catechol 2,3-dioxygenase-like lactoylglutathione lyase family enzyme